MARGGAAKEAANDTGRTELKTVVDNRTVGEILSEARIARDMDYTDVAEQLRIRRTYIEAIEEGRLGDLPGSTYAIGFVRTYAEMLDLDVPKVVAKFKQEAADFEDRTQLVFPEPMPGSHGPTVSVILIAILMLAGAYGGWLYISNKDSETIELVPPLPEALTKLLSQSTTVQEEAPAAVAAPAPAPAPSAAVEAESAAAPAPSVAEQPVIVNETIAAASSLPAAATAATDTAETSAVQVEEQPTEQAATQTEQAAPAAILETPAVETEAVVAEQAESAAEAVATTVDEPAQAEAAAAPASEPAQPAAAEEAETELPTVAGSEPAAFGSEAGESRIVIRATSPSWVEITTAQGEVLLNRLLRTGDTFRVPDQPGIKLVTGSAGGLEFTVDGKLAPPIGAIGDVRRDVLLEPEALLTSQ